MIRCISGNIIISPPSLCVEIDDASLRFPEYYFEIALAKKNVLVEMTWRTKSLRRSGPSLTIDIDNLVTTPEACDVTHFGSSIQVSNAIVKRLESFHMLKDVMSVQAWAKFAKASFENYSTEIHNRLRKYRDKLKVKGVKVTNPEEGGYRLLNQRKR